MKRQYKNRFTSEIAELIEVTEFYVGVSGRKQVRYTMLFPDGRRIDYNGINFIMVWEKINAQLD